MEIEYKFNYPEDREQMEKVHLFHAPNEIVKVNCAEHEISLVWETNGRIANGTSFHTLNERTMASFISTLDLLIYESIEDKAELQPEDYIISICFNSVTVHENEGKYLGEFNNDSLAVTFIAKRMKETKYFPNVWLQTSHGNISLIDMGKDYGIEVN